MDILGNVLALCIEGFYPLKDYLQVISYKIEVLFLKLKGFLIEATLTVP
jgi:hypothetical protein